MIYLFFGQPCSGKTTLAKHLADYHSLTQKVIHIDGDEYRQIIGNTGYDKDSRIQNLKSAFNTALFLEAKGFTVILSFVTPYLEARLYLKDKSPETKFIYLEYSAKEKRGRENFHVSEFEIPTQEELQDTNYTYINTTETPIDQCFKDVILL